MIHFEPYVSAGRGDAPARSRSRRVRSAALLALALAAPACAVEPGSLEDPAGGVSAAGQALTVDLDPRKSLLITDADVVSAFTLKEVLDQLSNGQALEVFHQMFATELQAATPGSGSGPHCDDVAAAGSINGWPAECPRPEGQEALRDPFGDDPGAGYMATTLSNRFDLAPASGENCGEYRINFARRSGIGQAGKLTRLFIAFEARLANPHPSEGLAGCRPVIAFWQGLSALPPATRASELHRFYFEGLPGFRPVIDVNQFGAVAGPQGGQIRVNQFLFIQSALGDWSAREFRLVPDGSGADLHVVLQPHFNKDVPARALFNPVASDPRAVRFQREFFVGSVERLALQDMNTMNYAASVPDEFNSGDSHMVGGANPRTELFNDYGAELGPDPSDLGARIQAQLTAIGSPLTPSNIVERATSLSCGGCHNISQDAQLARPLGLPAAFPRSLGFVQVSEDLVAIPEEPERQRFETSPLLAAVLPYRAQLMTDFLAPVIGFERDGGWTSSQAALSLSTTIKTEGASALAVVASNGWSEITSIPTSIVGAGAIGPELKLDLFVPTNQPNPSFRGQISLLVSIPSARISNQWIGQVSLDRVALGAFSSLRFPLPATLRRILGYGVTDVTFTIQLNVAANTSPYYLDHLRFH